MTTQGKGSDEAGAGEVSVNTRDRGTLTSIRLRFEECQRGNASLEAWRALQLDILDLAKHVSRTAIWAMLDEGFWLERDPTRVTHLIEGVLVELERCAGAK